MNLMLRMFLDQFILIIFSVPFINSIIFIIIILDLYVMFVYVLDLNEEIILMNFHYFSLIFHLMSKLLKLLVIKVLKFSSLIHCFYFIKMLIFTIYHLL